MTPAQQEMQILRKYAQGGDLPVIARECGVDIDAVSAVVTAVGFQRGRAAELLRQRESALVQHKTVKEATVHVEPQPDTIAQRLLRAETIPRLRTRALRIRAMLDDLSRDLEAAAQVADAELKVQRLRADLAAATEQLRTLTKYPHQVSTRPAPTAPTAAAITAADEDGPSPRDVRTWAARNGIDCAAAGKVPRTVVEQYLAAHQAGQVAA